MSARSLGDINVQVILEALGGGGNSTTAGGRIAGWRSGERPSDSCWGCHRRIF